MHRVADPASTSSSRVALEPSPRRARRVAMRLRILRAAREIFFRDGFLDASLDEIASRAEIGKGTLYRHFESKAEIYVGVLAENGATFEQHMLNEIPAEGGAVEKLQAIGDFYRRYWIERPDHFGIFWAVNSQTLIGELSGHVMEEISRIWERPLRLLESIIADGVRSGELRECDPWVMANVLWRAGNSMVEALVMPKRLRIVDCSPEAIYQATHDLILRGLVSAPVDS